MLLVKLTAEDLRMIRGARSQAEIEGCLALVKDRILAAETLKKFGKEPGPNKSERFRWEAAFKVAYEVLGDRLTKPPYPEYTWFARISSCIKQYGMDADYVRGLAEYARDNVYGAKLKFEFLICQHERILAGEFNKRPASNPPASTPATFGPELPES